MSGRYRYRRRSGWRSRRSTYRNRSSIVKRARGNMRAANAQADSTDVVINLMTKVKTGVTGINHEVTINGADVVKEFQLGTSAINIFELLKKSDFFNSYAPMYDQFRITSIKVKITPVSWKLYGQFNLPNQSIKIGEGSTINYPIGEPVHPGDTPNGTTYITEDTYIYPQSLTVITAWDRTGLDTAQLIEYAAGNPAVHHKFISIGDDITTYSSAKSSQLIPGANFNCTRYLYPSSQQEKSFYLSTGSLSEQQEYSLDDNEYWDITNPENAVQSTTNPCNLRSDPSCPFKPTFLLGIMSVEPIDIDTENQDTTIGVKKQIQPVLFNLEFDIGVTFRGLRKSQVV